MAEEHKTDYHAGLVAALKTKYDDQYDFMETIKEMILGEKPPRLDAVVQKKIQNNILLTRLAVSSLNIMCLSLRDMATV